MEDIEKDYEYSPNRFIIEDIVEYNQNNIILRVGLINGKDNTLYLEKCKNNEEKTCIDKTMISYGINDLSNFGETKDEQYLNFITTLWRENYVDKNLLGHILEEFLEIKTTNEIILD